MKRWRRLKFKFEIKLCDNLDLLSETDGLPKAPSVENEIQEVQSQREVKRQLSARKFSTLYIIISINV